jgi:hypothetical protein
MYDSHISTLAIPSMTPSPSIDRYICSPIAAAKQAKREAAREARRNRRTKLLKQLDGEETEPAGQGGALAYLFGR